MKLCGGKLLNYLLRGQLISSPFYWWSCTWMYQEMSRNQRSTAPFFSFTNAVVYFQYLICQSLVLFFLHWKWKEKSEAMQCAAATAWGLTDSIWCSVRTERPPPSLRPLTRKEGEGMSLCSSVHARTAAAARARVCVSMEGRHCSLTSPFSPASRCSQTRLCYSEASTGERKCAKHGDGLIERGAREENIVSKTD